MKKTSNNTKSRIVSAAWRLFYEQGYEETTIDDIVALSGTSKGSFYHYFSAKDDLLGSLSFLFDEKYEELLPYLEEKQSSTDKLIYLNEQLFSMIENTVSVYLLARLLSSQLITHGDKHLLDRNRLYYRLLRQVVITGQESGELRDDLSANEIVKMYALCERGLLYDWCICNGEYSLKSYGRQMMPLFLMSLKRV